MIIAVKNEKQKTITEVFIDRSPINELVSPLDLTEIANKMMELQAAEADKLIGRFLNLHGFEGEAADALENARSKGYDLMRSYDSLRDVHQIKLVRVVDAYGFKFISKIGETKI